MGPHPSSSSSSSSSRSQRNRHCRAWVKLRNGPPPTASVSSASSYTTAPTFRAIPTLFPPLLALAGAHARNRRHDPPLLHAAPVLPEPYKGQLRAPLFTTKPTPPLTHPLTPCARRNRGLDRRRSRDFNRQLRHRHCLRVIAATTVRLAVRPRSWCSPRLRQSRTESPFRRQAVPRHHFFVAAGHPRPLFAAWVSAPEPLHSPLSIRTLAGV